MRGDGILIISMNVSSMTTVGYKGITYIIMQYSKCNIVLT